MDTRLSQNLEKIKSGNLTEKERQELLAMFHESDLEFDLKKQLLTQLEDSKDDFSGNEESHAMFDRFWNRVVSEKQHKNKKIPFRFVYWAAAILVVGIVIGNLFRTDFVSPAQSAYYISKAPKGSVSETILPDGTIIFLNADSEIKYVSARGKKVREVYLDGEAWFNVEKSKEIPFVVHTSFYDVRVMGTEFNVKAYADEEEVTTTLEEGSIEIVSTDKLKLANNVLLKPGEQLVYNKIQKELHVNQVRTDIYSAWKENKLVFINMSLAELVRLLERKYGVEINVTDESLLNYHYDGTFKNETIIEVLNILQKTIPIDYKLNDQEVIITKKQIDK